MSLMDKEPDVVKDGIRYWNCGEHRGYEIFYVETEDGERTYLATDNKLPKQWIASGTSLEDIGAKIDMIDLTKRFK